MVQSSKLVLDLLADGGARNEIRANEWFYVLEAINNATIPTGGFELNTPPGTPESGKVYVVGASGTGDWAGRDGDVAVFIPGGTWKFIDLTTYPYFEAWEEGANLLRVWNGTSWTASSPTGLAWSSQSADFNASVLNAYLVDTTGGPVTVTLPDIAADGDQIRIVDAGGNAATNNITINADASDTIEGSASFVISTNSVIVDLFSNSTSNDWIAQAETSSADNLGNHIATQNLDMGAFEITNVGNVDGRDVSTDGTNQDALQTLTGRPAASVDMGTFTGALLTDNQTVQVLLQELETAVEALQKPAAQVFSSAAVSTTTSTTMQSKITGTTIALPSRDYKITVSYSWNHDAAGNDFQAELLINSVAAGSFSTGLIHAQEPKDAANPNIDGTGTNQIHSFTKVFVQTLSGATQFDLNYATEVNGVESSIWDATIIVEALDA